ncbi:MAG: type II toxin-antitoxin system HicA family toxin [Phycisphaerae bacterium]|nr:type II toxin-antitoxin system HicA family toxin [Phycisphaerae bacterium]
MKLPRDMSGRQLAQRLERAYGYSRIHQRGSHIIVQVDTPTRHRLTIPDHTSLRPGTLNAILRGVARARQSTKETVLRAVLR